MVKARRPIRVPVSSVVVDRADILNEEVISTHRLRVEGDTVLTRYVGVPELEHVMAIHQYFDRVLAEHGRLFVINDMSRSGIPTAEARQWLAEWARTHKIVAIVNFGASMPVRMLQSLIMNAAALLGSGPRVKTANCADEAEAFAWIAAHRGQLR